VLHGFLVVRLVVLAGARRVCAGGLSAGAGLLVGVGGCLVELLGESLVLGSCGVEVGFGAVGALQREPP
jgi:hypothetical protein